MREHVYVNYNNEGGTSVVKCDCGHSFEFQTKPTGYCPGCGGKIIGYKADNVPMDLVPNGYKAYLFNMYEQYRKEYYFDSDNWGPVFAYLRSIYNNISNIDEDVFNGWCYKKNYTPVFYRKTEDKTYMGYEDRKGNFKTITEKGFCTKLKLEADKINAKREVI